MTPSELSLLDPEERRLWELEQKATPNISFDGGSLLVGQYRFILRADGVGWKANDFAFFESARNLVKPLLSTVVRLRQELARWHQEMALVTALGEQCSAQDVGDFIVHVTNTAMERKERAELAESRISTLILEKDSLMQERDKAKFDAYKSEPSPPAQPSGERQRTPKFFYNTAAGTAIRLDRCAGLAAKGLTVTRRCTKEADHQGDCDLQPVPPEAEIRDEAAEPSPRVERQSADEHEVDRKAQEIIDANPGCTISAAYRAVAMDAHAISLITAEKAARRIYGSYSVPTVEWMTKVIAEAYSKEVMPPEHADTRRSETSDSATAASLKTSGLAVSAEAKPPQCPKCNGTHLVYQRAFAVVECQTGTCDFKQDVADWRDFAAFFPPERGEELPSDDKILEFVRKRAKTLAHRRLATESAEEYEVRFVCDALACVQEGRR